MHTYLVSKKMWIWASKCQALTKLIFTTGIHGNEFCLDKLWWYLLHISIQNDLIQLRFMANFNDSLEMIMRWFVGTKSVSA